MSDVTTRTPAATPLRANILAALREAGPATVAELAERLDVHENTVRFHLKKLVELAQVEADVEALTGLGRPPTRYRRTTTLHTETPAPYQLLAQILARALSDTPDAHRQASEAGRSLVAAWSASLGLSIEPTSGTRAAVEQLTSVLTAAGFDPTLERPDEIGLRKCPFLDLVTDSNQTICAIHQGLMNGVLEQTGAPVTVGHLEPFAGPALCSAHLRPTTRPRSMA